jgi:predicted kinase
MKTVWMFKGLPASGKTTEAKKMLETFGSGNARRVNKDDLRSMLDDGRWSRGNEAFVLEIRDHIISRTLEHGKHVLVDDTNLAPKHSERLRQLALLGGASFEVIDFTHVSVEDCIKRDLKRPVSVGERVIRDMYDQFLRSKVEPPAHDPSLPDAIIVDIDGTVAQINGRGPFDWGRVYEDSPREAVIRIARKLWETEPVDVIFLSGRDTICREDTQRWLDVHWGTGSSLWLWMRPNGDMRKDVLVKRELYEAHIKGKFNVIAVFDDRPQVLRLWAELGFTDRIFNVGDGREF